MLNADYFDGRSTRVRVVGISLDERDLVVTGDDVDIRLPFAAVRVDERLGRAPRRLRFADGSFCVVRDLAGLDELLSAAGHVDGRVDRMQRQSRMVLAALVAGLVLVFAAYRWGLPWAAEQGARRMPPAIGVALSEQTLHLLDGGILRPSAIDAARRERISDRFHALRLPEGGMPGSALLFRASPQLGANAFTLPDGTILLLDDLVTSGSVGSDERILAVLAHELGHVHGRHPLQLLLRSTAVGAFMSFYVGDISQLLAAAPAAVVQAKYSQELERQADDYGAAVLLRNGMSPRLLADALADLARSHPASASGGYLSSHPSTDARIRHLRDLAAHPGLRIGASQ